MNLYSLNPPESEQDALTPDDDLGCPDCGDTPCTCDERCPGCLHKFQSKADEAVGLCPECQQDRAEQGRDEFGGGEAA